MTARDAIEAAEPVAPIPRGADGEPAFREPWEAQAFAMALALHEKGAFTWAEWAEVLGEEIAAAREGKGSDAYYRHWLAALERLVTEKGVAGTNDLALRRAAFARAAAATPHGEPILLENDPGPDH